MDPVPTGLGYPLPHETEGGFVRQFHLRIAVCLSLSLGLSLFAGIDASPQQPPQTSLTRDALFQLTKVWTVHLTLSSEAWDTLTPAAPSAAAPAPAPPPPPPPGPPPPPPRPPPQ